VHYCDEVFQDVSLAFRSHGLASVSQHARADKRTATGSRVRSYTAIACAAPANHAEHGIRARGRPAKLARAH
jgi:hypothetical protein